jgi:serine/threonine-protein kinase RsbW
MIKEITIGNKPAELRRVAAFVDELGDEFALDGELLMNLNLVLEEMVTNIINYAYPQPTEDAIELRAESDGKEIVLTLADRGVAFDPTMRGDLNTDVNPAEREIGGMGIFMVKKSMDDVQYRYESGENILTIRKKLQ